MDSIRQLKLAVDGFRESVSAIPEELDDTVAKPLEIAIGDFSAECETLGRAIGRAVPVVRLRWHERLARFFAGDGISDRITTIAGHLQWLENNIATNPVLAAQNDTRRFNDYLRQQTTVLDDSLEAVLKSIGSLPKRVSELGEDLQAAGEEVVGEIEELLEAAIEEILDGVETAIETVFDEGGDTVDILESADDRLLEALDDAIRQQLIRVLEDIGVTQTLSQSLTSVSPQLAAYREVAGAARTVLEAL